MLETEYGSSLGTASGLTFWAIYPFNLRSEPIFKLAGKQHQILPPKEKGFLQMSKLWKTRAYVNLRWKISDIKYIFEVYQLI